MKRWGREVKRLRIEARLSREEFGKRIGYSKRSIQGWENGDLKRMPSDNAMFVVDLFFNRDVSGLRLVRDAVTQARRVLITWTRDERAMMRGLSLLGISCEAVVSSGGSN